MASKKKKNDGVLPPEQQNSGKNDAWAHYNLAVEYHKQGQNEKALEEINRAILIFVESKLKPPALTYKLKYNLLILERHYANAYNGIVKAIALYPDFVDLHFYKGISQYANCEYESATKTFSYCLILGESALEYQVLTGAGSFLAYHYLGLCYQKLDRHEEAFQAFRQADALCPDLARSSDYKHYLPA